MIELSADFRRHGQGVDFMHLCTEMKTNLEHILNCFGFLNRFSFEKFIGTTVGDTRVQTKGENKANVDPSGKTYRMSSMPLGKLQKAIFSWRFSGTGCSGCW